MKLDFQNFGELIDKATISPYSAEASRWNGNANHADAIKLARDGWQEGSAKIAKLANVITDKITSMIETQTIRYDVTGNDFDVALMLTDAPEYWTTLETVEGSNNRMLRVIFNCGTSGDVGSEIMMAKGATIAALVAAFEIAEIRIQVDLFSRVALRGQSFQVTARVKNADQPLDIDRLAFALAHPAMLRQLIFGLRKHNGMADEMLWLPCEMKDAPKDAIYIGRSFSGEPQWTNETSAIEWIKDQLTAQGVHLSE